MPEPATPTFRVIVAFAGSGAGGLCRALAAACGVDVVDTSLSAGEATRRAADADARGRALLIRDHADRSFLPHRGNGFQPVARLERLCDLAATGRPILATALIRHPADVWLHHRAGNRAHDFRGHDFRGHDFRGHDTRGRNIRGQGIRGFFKAYRAYLDALLASGVARHRFEDLQHTPAATLPSLAEALALATPTNFASNPDHATHRTITSATPRRPWLPDPQRLELENNADYRACCELAGNSTGGTGTGGNRTGDTADAVSYDPAYRHAPRPATTTDTTPATMAGRRPMRLAPERLEAAAAHARAMGLANQPAAHRQRYRRAA